MLKAKRFLTLTKNLLFITVVCCLSSAVYSQIPDKPYSYAPEIDFQPCHDTIKVLWYKKVVDMGLMFPTWHPVRNHQDNVVFEGTVIKTPNTTRLNTHVSMEDFPSYHYTHDFSFNAVPDMYPDNRYSNLLARMLTQKNENGTPIYDTAFQKYIHMEWETGLGISAKNNPCAELNRQGKSCGFFTAGHERGDTIWNFPTIGDWVHVEGLWIWDRGHPPADAEIHPMRLIAIRRHLPEKIPHPEKPGTTIWATRIDLFASGDGGALYNNRNNQPPFTNRVKMSEKDYSINIKPLLQKPSFNSTLKYVEVTQKGNTFSQPIIYDFVRDEHFNSLLHININWKNQPDTLVVAKTIFLYWDEKNGKSESQKIYSYKVTLQKMNIHKRKEFFTKAEYRSYLNVGSRYFFTNDLFGKNDILKDGFGKTYRRKWKLNISFEVNVIESDEFRVHANCWEEDGIDQTMGELLDPYLPCSKQNRKKARHALRNISPFRMKGCLNDAMGVIHDFHNVKSIGDSRQVLSFGSGGKADDVCLCNNDIQDGAMSLRYIIELLKVE
jgi:hypothetical protein